MYGYDLYNLQRDYGPYARSMGLQAMPSGSSAPGTPEADGSSSIIGSLWGKAKKTLGKTQWGDGSPVAEGNAMGALTTGTQALAGLFQMGEDEKAQQRGYGMQDLALANDLYEARRKRMQQTNALRAAAAVG